MSFIINFDKYQEFVGQTAIFPGNIGIVYCALKMNGEVGEVAEKVSVTGVVSDEDFGAMFEKTVDGIILELGDVIWYATALSRELGSTVAACRIVSNEDDLSEDGFVAHYNLLRLKVNAGAIAEKIGKFVRDQKAALTNDAFLADGKLVHELRGLIGNLIENVDMISYYLGRDLSAVIQANVAKLESRRSRGVLKGSGDNR